MHKPETCQGTGRLFLLKYCIMSKLTIGLILWCLFALVACNNHLRKVEESVDGVTEKYTINKKTGLKEGVFLRMEGNLKLEEAEYKDGKLNGIRKIFDDQGTVLIQETYVNDEFHGPYYQYHPNGQVQLEFHYENSVLRGEQKQYYDNGQLMEIVMFENNKENGPFTEYYENGNLKAEGHYLDGDNEHGLLKLYNEEGKLVKKMECDRGRCKTIWEAKDQKN